VGEKMRRRAAFTAMVLLALLLAHCASGVWPQLGAQEKGKKGRAHAAGVPPDGGLKAALTCGEMVTVILAEDARPAGKGFDLMRACELYADLVRHHIWNARERPAAMFRVVRDLQGCAQADLTCFVGEPPEVVACVTRTARATEIRIARDDMRHYVVALIDAVDYANRLYLGREEILVAASRAIAEVGNPELRKKFHSVVSAGELKGKR